MPKNSQIALTIKFNPNGYSTPDLSDIYKYVFAYYKRAIPSLRVKAAVFELDSKGKLHLHAHITAHSTVLYKEFRIPSFMVYTKPMTNQPGWYSYMYKKPYQLLTSQQLNLFSKQDFHSITDLLDHIKSEHNPQEAKRADESDTPDGSRSNGSPP